MLYFSGINLVSVLKLDFLFWQLVAATGMYVWLRRGMTLSKNAALIGAIFYLYSPINIAQVFVRGSLRELSSSAIFPIVLYFVGRLKDQSTKCGLALAIIITSVYLLADGLTVLTFAPILLAYLTYLFLSSKDKPNLAKNLIIVFVVSLFTAGYIYLPFILESKFLKGGVLVYMDHLVYWKQYLDYHWGFGFSEPGEKDSISFQIGAANIMAFLVFVFLLIKKRLKLSPLLGLFFVCLGIYFVLMTESTIGLFLGRSVSLLSLIQYPWRFLIPAVFIFSFIAATVIEKLKPTKKIILLILLIVIAISFRYLRTNQVVVYDQRYLTYNAGDATAFHEFIPVWRNKTSEFSGFPDKIEIVSGQGTISRLIEKNSNLSFYVTSSDPMTLRINTLYYPGWKAFIDNKEIPITITTNLHKQLTEKRDISGLMSISLLPGSHSVALYFEDTQIRKIGKMFSLLGILATVALLI